MNALMLINWLLTLLTPVIPNDMMDTVIDMFNTLTTMVDKTECELERTKDFNKAKDQALRSAELSLDEKQRRIAELCKENRALENTVEEHAESIDQLYRNRVSKVDHNHALKELEQLRKTNAHYSNKLSKEEVTCSKAIDDLARLSGLLLSDEEAFEKLVARASTKGPCPRTAKLVKTAWDNDPSGVHHHDSNPGKIMDYIKYCCKKHN